MANAALELHVARLYSKMQNYFKEREYFIEHIWFHADGSHHYGNGVMTWNPKTGFHIAARVKRSKPLPSKKEIKIISFNHGTLIRLKLDNKLFAFAPRVNIDDLALVNERLLLDFNRLIFIQDK